MRVPPRTEDRRPGTILNAQAVQQGNGEIRRNFWASNLSAIRSRAFSRWSSVVGLFLLALLLRLYHLGTQSLWLDELNTWSLITQANWDFLWNELWRGESAYPLYHLLLKGWVALAGDSEWAMRFPSALAGAGAVLAVAAAGGEMEQSAVSTQKAEGRRQKASQSPVGSQISQFKTQNSGLKTHLPPPSLCFSRPSPCGMRRK